LLFGNGRKRRLYFFGGYKKNLAVTIFFGGYKEIHPFFWRLKLSKNTQSTACVTTFTIFGTAKRTVGISGGT
jgi:hypothetical protein